MNRILVIRRDNIGDLACTTPLIRALRQRYPSAQIDALVNSYNLPVLAHNPDLNGAYAYTKAKHRAASESLIGVAWRRLRLMWQLRATRYDLVVLANGGCYIRPLRLAQLVKPRHVLGFYEPDIAGSELIDMRVTESLPRTVHEAEHLFQLLKPLGITPPVPPMVLAPDPAEHARASALLRQQTWYRPERPTLAVHISARKPSQRWPTERFVECLKMLAATRELQFMLFWSPGDEHNPLHPGDDQKAAAIRAGLPADFPLLPWPTAHLQELIGGLSVCSGMLCSDGGAMHLGASLGLPIACFFGQSDVTTWRPWGVDYRVMQPASRDVSDVSCAEALSALEALWPGIEARVQR